MSFKGCRSLTMLATNNMLGGCWQSLDERGPQLACNVNSSYDACYIITLFGTLNHKKPIQTRDLYEFVLGPCLSWTHSFNNTNWEQTPRLLHWNALSSINKSAWSSLISLCICTCNTIGDKYVRQLWCQIASFLRWHMIFYKKIDK